MDASPKGPHIIGRYRTYSAELRLAAQKKTTVNLCSHAQTISGFLVFPIVAGRIIVLLGLWTLHYTTLGIGGKIKSG